MLIMDTKSKCREIVSFIENNAPQIASSGIVAHLSATASSPEHAALFAMFGITADMIINTIADTTKKNLSSRESARTASCAIYIMQNIRERILRGDIVRKDNFFAIEDSSNRTPSEEIMEGVLIKVRDEYEEKKLQFMAKLITNICFDESISLAKANFLIKLVEKLTYEQLCIIRYFNDIKRSKLNWGHSFSTHDELNKFNDINSSTEELIVLKLIDAMRTTGGTILSVALSKLGCDVYCLLNLENIDIRDINEVHRKFEEVKQIIKSKE